MCVAVIGWNGNHLISVFSPPTVTFDPEAVLSRQTSHSAELNDPLATLGQGVCHSVAPYNVEQKSCRPENVGNVWSDAFCWTLLDPVVLCGSVNFKFRDFRFGRDRYCRPKYMATVYY